MQSLSFLAVVLFAAPVVWMVVLSFLQPEENWPIMTLGAGIVIGILVLVGGTFWGGYLVRKRGPELLAFTLRN